MRRISVLVFAMVLAAAGCAPRSAGTMPGTSNVPKAPAGFTVPAAPPNFVPAPPPAWTPPARPSSVDRGAPVRNSVAYPFFNGENALGNGAYYLALPNSNIFGYYAYLPDTHYIYHFDAGYFYMIDAGGPNGGIYLYDFLSQRWWYTSRTFAWPYVYQFASTSVLYYYPQSNPQHYTTHPRLFYDFGAAGTTMIPQEPPDWSLDDASGSIQMTPSTGTISLGPVNGLTISNTWGANDAAGQFAMPVGMATSATHTTPGGFPPMVLQGIHAVGYFKVSAFPARTFSSTPSFTFTVGPPSTFGGTTCDIYNLNYSQDGTAAWTVFGIPAAQPSGSSVTFPSIPVPQGNTLRIESAGYGGPGYIALGCH